MCVWILFGLSEPIVVRTLQLIKYKHVSGINDNFFARLIFRFNVLFTFGAHVGLFYLGSLGSDELLTGNLGLSRGVSHFYTITIGALSLISVIGLVTCSMKRFEAYWKEKEITESINIMISNEQQQPEQKINNNKYNEPINNSFVVFMNTILFIAIFGCI